VETASVAFVFELVLEQRGVLEKETHGKTFDEVRQPDEAEQLLKKYGWTKVYDETKRNRKFIYFLLVSSQIFLVSWRPIPN